ncbi:hypothetical protein FRC02_009588 [Tulasnella sp. 418]|nr:hypothetical protein FRC02_009588 [Tulasnella sp. 418]
MSNNIAYTPLHQTDSNESSSSREYGSSSQLGDHVAWLLRFFRRSRVAMLIVPVALLGALGLAHVFVGQAKVSESGLDTATRNYPLVAHDSSRYLNGAAMNSFRENLKKDAKYVTAWNYAGLTNDFMVHCNIIYLGMISSRIPIIPPFVPLSQHIGNGGFLQDFSEFFDLPGLRAALNHPILEWSQVKKAPYAGNTANLKDVVEEPLGCWSNWELIGPNGDIVYTELAPFLSLDVSYTPTPEYIGLTGKPGYHTSLWGLVSILYPDGRAKALRQKESVPSVGASQNQALLPDDQLACFDVLYFSGVREEWEWERDYSPVWNLVAKYARFTQKVEDVSMFYLRKVFNVGRNEDVPPFISMHIRRTDFIIACGPEATPETCFLPLSAYSDQVKKIQSDLLALHGPKSPLSKVTHVFVASDEKNNEWWGSIRQQGWYFIDHGSENIAEVHGSWYPSLIDAYILARGAGFVGTRQSTMSLVAARRVQDWNGGPTRMAQSR